MQRKNADAEKELLRCAEAEPNRPGVWRTLSILCLDMNRLTDAILTKMRFVLLESRSERGQAAARSLEELYDLDEATLHAAGAHVLRHRFVLDELVTETDEALRARARCPRSAGWCSIASAARATLRSSCAIWARGRTWRSRS